jgi:S1-C subfamily serine protease
MAAMAQPKKTLYQILGVAREATPEQISLAHEMKTAEMQHARPPDPSGVALVQQAYEILSSPERRAAYDASLVTAAERAAAAQQAPDLEVDAEDAEDADKKRKMRLMAMVGGMAVVLILLFLAFRPKAPHAPPPEPVAEAPKPAPPPPPKLRTGGEILADASTSSGQLLSYSMSGAATPIGMALEIEQGQVVTTCHGIPAGAKIVVKVGAQVLPADLNITDEELDLCRMSVAGFTTPPLKVAAEDAKAGDKVFAVGMNAKGELAATEGTVKQVRATPAGKVLELSMPVAASGSGGGVFNDQGQLVGIATTPHAFGAGLSIALPVSWIAQMRSRSAPPPK